MVLSFEQNIDLPGLSEAASAAESLRFVLYGTALVLPVIVLYTIFSYRVFWGKTTELKYY